MIKKEWVSQFKWIILALMISFVLVSMFENAVFFDGVIMQTQHTFLGLNLYLEILIFFVFSTFVVFGIKGFFEMYSQKIANIILSFSGVLLLFVIFILCYQIFFQDRLLL
jgi:hypothetical protein